MEIRNEYSGRAAIATQTAIYSGKENGKCFLQKPHIMLFQAIDVYIKVSLCLAACVYPRLPPLPSFLAPSPPPTAIPIYVQISKFGNWTSDGRAAGFAGFRAQHTKEGRAA